MGYNGDVVCIGNANDTNEPKGLCMDKSVNDGGMIQSPCIWETNDDDMDSRVKSDCGHEPYFEDEVTKEYLTGMGYKFCPYCGRVIIVSQK